MLETIGFIGLGRMGRPMARRLLAAGYPVLGYDADPSALAAVAADGVTPAPGAAVVAAEAEFIITMLPDSAAVETVVLGSGGICEAARAGQVLIDMSSGSPAVTRRLAAALADRGVYMLDAPVSGGVRGAEAGTLAIMVGGDQAVFERCLPMFRAVGQNIRYVGGSGAGHALKAINNLLSATHLWSVCEALLIGIRTGLDPHVMVEVINSSTGRSGSTEVKLPRHVLPRRFDSGFPIGLMHKDLTIALDLAREMNISIPLSALVRELWGIAVARGEGARDHTAIIELVEFMAGAGQREGSS